MVYILGHSPYEFGIVPDPDGFVAIKDLVRVMHEEPDMPHANEGRINEVLMSEERGLFESYGKSIRVFQDNGFFSASLPQPIFLPCFLPLSGEGHISV